jgi:hypothetical protein
MLEPASCPPDGRYVMPLSGQNQPQKPDRKFGLVERATWWREHNRIAPISVGCIDVPKHDEDRFLLICTRGFLRGTKC